MTQALIRPTVTELVPLLGPRADYAFIYRSVAHGHNVPYVRLAPEVNLADPSEADFYAQAEVKLEQPERTIRGAPIVYGLTVPTNAENPRGGAAFVAALLSPQGRRILDRNGFDSLPEYVCDHPDRLPPSLRQGLSIRAAEPGP
jgi:molybdate/tungstate transport system substrate-binding protein